MHCVSTYNIRKLVCTPGCLAGFRLVLVRGDYRLDPRPGPA